MFPDLKQRQRQPEWMDDPAADPGELAASLRFIRRINALLGYTRQTLSHLQRFSHGWKPGERITILDLATGSADIPRAVLRWAHRHGFDVHVVGVDLHAATAATAAAVRDPRLKIVQADVLNLPFAAGSFDYAICNMFLHHLDDAAAIATLRAMGQVARRGVIAADLLRHRRAYFWISLLTLFSNRMVRHDARVSVAQAFGKDEVLRIASDAGLGFARYYRHPAHRFSLAGEKKTIHE